MSHFPGVLFALPQHFLLPGEAGLVGVLDAQHETATGGWASLQAQSSGGGWHLPVQMSGDPSGADATGLGHYGDHSGGWLLG